MSRAVAPWSQFMTLRSVLTPSSEFRLLMIAGGGYIRLSAGTGGLPDFANFYNQPQGHRSATRGGLLGVLNPPKYIYFTYERIELIYIAKF